MRFSRWVLFWLLVIGALVLIEIAELTRLFRFPIESALGDPVGLLLALVYTTVLALIGAIFVGIYISRRVLSPQGFSPFEEEMLHMRADLLELRRSVEEIRAHLGNGSTAPDTRSNGPTSGRTEARK
jgi:hypothetical protein